MALAPVHSSEAFAKYIEHSVRQKKMTYMDSVLAFCHERHLEPEMIVPYLSDKIRNAIATEGRRLHLLTSMTSELPFDND